MFLGKDGREGAWTLIRAMNEGRFATEEYVIGELCRFDGSSLKVFLRAGNLDRSSEVQPSLSITRLPQVEALR